MTTVYWSPWYQNTTLYTENYLTHYPMDSVYKDLLSSKETRNIRDNFFNCHAFKGFCKELYLLRNPYSIDLEYVPHENRFKSRKEPKGSLMDLAIIFITPSSFCIKPSTRSNFANKISLWNLL